MDQKYVELDGLVVREVKLGEGDKILKILSAEHGLVTISGKGLSNLKNKYAASTQLFSYSTLQLKKRGEYYYIADAFLIDCFIGIRYDVEKLALANYVCDVAHDIALEDSSDSELLSLTLNTLYAISKLDLPLEHIKGAFEFRTAVIEGYMPDLSSCGICGCEIDADSTLDVMNGHLMCKKCGKVYENSPEYIRDQSSAKIFLRITPPILDALRYIAYAPPKKFLSFSLDRDELYLFADVCEKYLLNHLERGFSSLDYYKKIKL